ICETSLVNGLDCQLNGGSETGSCTSTNSEAATDRSRLRTRSASRAAAAAAAVTTSTSAPIAVSSAAAVTCSAMNTSPTGLSTPPVSAALSTMTTRKRQHNFLATSALSHSDLSTPANSARTSLNTSRGHSPTLDTAAGSTTSSGLGCWLRPRHKRERDSLNGLTTDRGNTISAISSSNTSSYSDSSDDGSSIGERPIRSDSRHSARRIDSERCQQRKENGDDAEDDVELVDEVSANLEFHGRGDEGNCYQTSKLAVTDLTSICDNGYTASARCRSHPESAPARINSTNCRPVSAAVTSNMAASISTHLLDSAADSPWLTSLTATVAAAAQAVARALKTTTRAVAVAAASSTPHGVGLSLRARKRDRGARRQIFRLLQLRARRRHHTRQRSMNRIKSQRGRSSGMIYSGTLKLNRTTQGATRCCLAKKLTESAVKPPTSGPDRLDHFSDDNILTLALDGRGDRKADRFDASEVGEAWRLKRGQPHTLKRLRHSSSPSISASTGFTATATTPISNLPSFSINGICLTEGPAAKRSCYSPLLLSRAPLSSRSNRSRPISGLAAMLSGLPTVRLTKFDNEKQELELRREGLAKHCLDLAKREPDEVGGRGDSQSTGWSTSCEPTDLTPEPDFLSECRDLLVKVRKLISIFFLSLG
ncbi:unnamed protein product, partial [Protopolystoma xenopodis]